MDGPRSLDRYRGSLMLVHSKSNEGALLLDGAPPGYPLGHPVDGQEYIPCLARVARLGVRPSRSRPLVGDPGLSHIRVGDDRVVYSVKDAKLDLVTAGHAPDRATQSLRSFHDPERSRIHA